MWGWEGWGIWERLPGRAGFEVNVEGGVASVLRRVAQAWAGQEQDPAVGQEVIQAALK